MKMTGYQPKLDFLNKETVEIKKRCKNLLKFWKENQSESKNRDILI